MIAINNSASDISISERLELDKPLDIFTGVISDSLTFVWDEASKSNTALNDQLNKTQPSK